MKGILKNTTAGWFVWYQVMKDEITSGYESLPLHPDNVKDLLDTYEVNPMEGREVEYEEAFAPTISVKSTPLVEDCH